MAARKAKVLATLLELQNEVAPITYATEKLKDTDHMKDSKSFLNILQKEYDVSINSLLFFYKLFFKYNFFFFLKFKNEWVDSAYKMGKYFYECGRYAQSISHLYFCLLVMQPTDKVITDTIYNKKTLFLNIYFIYFPIELP